MTRSHPGTQVEGAVGAFLTFALVLTGCDLLEPRDRFSHLEVSAAGEVAFDTIHYSLSVHNTSDRDVTLTYGGCRQGAIPSVYRMDPAGERLVWARARIPPGTTACTLEQRLLAIGAGGVETVEGFLPLQRLREEEIVPGEYLLRLAPDFDQSLEDRKLEVTVFELR